MANTTSNTRYNTGLILIGSGLFLGACGLDIEGPDVGESSTYLQPSEDGILLGAEPIADQYIVLLRGAPARALATTRSAAQDLILAHGADEGGLRQVYAHAVQGFSIEMTRQQAIQMAADPRVALVEENQLTRIVGTQANATWGIDRVDQVNLPLDSTYTYSTDGAGVNVYVIDTGVKMTHNEFTGRTGTAVKFGLFNLTTDDQHGHGTHVAGTILGSTYGIAQGARINSVRVLNAQGTGNLDDMIAGINWVVQNHQSPAVANLSVGVNGISSALDSALVGLVNSGVTVVVAAGNSGDDACNYSPGDVAAAITVAATDASDVRASFSNYGSCVDLFAPGVNITSAWKSTNSATNVMSGTSMATPHVSGMAARYLQNNQGASNAQVKSALISGTSGSCVSDPQGTPNRLLNTNLSGGTCSGGGGGAYCGDGTCNGSETCSSCASDCGACAYCGDGTCNGSETCSSCASDCGSCATYCGDGTCNGSETCSTCSADCGSCGGGSCQTQGQSCSASSDCCNNFCWQGSCLL